MKHWEIVPHEKIMEELREDYSTTENLRNAILKKMIFTSDDWAVKTGRCTKEELEKQNFEYEFYRELDLVQEILAAQISIYILRRMPMGQDNTYAMNDILLKLEKEYESKYGDFVDLNKDVSY